MKDLSIREQAVIEGVFIDLERGVKLDLEGVESNEYLSDYAKDVIRALVGEDSAGQHRFYTAIYQSKFKHFKCPSCFSFRNGFKGICLQCKKFQVVDGWETCFRQRNFEVFFWEEKSLKDGLCLTLSNPDKNQGISVSKLSGYYYAFRFSHDDVDTPLSKASFDTLTDLGKWLTEQMELVYE